MRKRSIVLWLFAAGCQPVEVHFPGDASPWTGTPPAAPVDPVLTPADVDSSGARTCQAPHLRDELGPFERRMVADSSTSLAYLWSGGVLAGDLDSDGVLDLIAPAERRTRLYQGQREGGYAITRGGHLQDFDLHLGTGGSLADYDGDGDLDVLVLRWDRPNVLLENDGAGGFTDVTAEVGLDEAIAASTASAWGDYDRDGDLDLFVGSYNEVEGDGVGSGSFLYENLEGFFVDRSDRLPPELQQAYTRVAGFHDLDGDMYPELYVVNDIGLWQPNVLLHNDHGTFVRHPAAGLDLAMSGGGLGVGDLNGDGLPDLLIPQWDEISLMLSTTGGRWVDYRDQWELSLQPDQTVGWGAELADLDNDGDLDAHVAYGRIEVDSPDWSNPDHQPDALFLQEDGRFVDAGAEWGVADRGTQRGFVVLDLNDDGWLDLVKRDLDGPDLMYLSRCGREHWLEVTLRDTTARNVFAVGARVRVLLTDGTALTRSITAGGTGFGTGGPPEVHFGLGAADTVDRIEVTWPDNRVSQVGFGEAADQTLTITRR